MGTENITDQEKELFQTLYPTRIHMTDEEMFTIFDKRAYGVTIRRIASDLNRTNQTVSNVVNLVSRKHQKAYERWLKQRSDNQVPEIANEPQSLELINTEQTQSVCTVESTSGNQADYIALLLEHNEMLKDYIKLLKTIKTV
jgi:IS30 family transposase